MRSEMAPCELEDLPRHLWPVLEQLMTSATDVTASRRLNISPRTFSRRVAELLDVLGAQTRFQGGIQVARLGWTSSPMYIEAMARSAGSSWPRG